MTANEILNQARILLGINLESATVAETIKKALLEKATTTDGVVIGTETEKPFEIGDNILWTNPESGIVEGCPDGEYVLEDGRTIVVGEMTIKDIKPKSEEAPAEDAPSTDEAAQSLTQSKIDLSKLNEEVVLLKSENTKLKTDLEKATQDKIQLNSVVELLKSEPGAEPTVRTASISGDNTIKHNKSLHTKSDYLMSVGKMLNSK